MNHAIKSLTSHNTDMSYMTAPKLISATRYTEFSLDQIDVRRESLGQSEKVLVRSLMQCIIGPLSILFSLSAGTSVPGEPSLYDHSALKLPAPPARQVRCGAFADTCRAAPWTDVRRLTS